MLWLNSIHLHWFGWAACISEAGISRPGQINPIYLHCWIPPEVSEEMCFIVIWMNQTFKARSFLRLSEVVMLQDNSTEVENQTGKSMYSYSLKLCQFFFFNMQFDSYTTTCHVPVHMQTRVRRKIARRTRIVNTPARESPTAHVLQASTVTSVKVLYASGLADAHCRQLGQVASSI